MMRLLSTVFTIGAMMVLPAQAGYCNRDPIAHVGSVAVVTFENEPRQDGQTYGRVIDFLKGDGPTEFRAGGMDYTGQVPPIKIIMFRPGSAVFTDPGCSDIFDIPRIEGQDEELATARFFVESGELREFAEYESLNADWAAFIADPTAEMAESLLPRLGAIRDTIRISMIEDMNLQAGAEGDDQLMESYRRAMMSEKQLELAERMVGQGRTEYEKFEIEARLNLGQGLPETAPLKVDGMILGRLDFGTQGRMPTAITNSQVEHVFEGTGKALRVDLSGSDVKAFVSGFLDLSSMQTRGAKLVGLASFIDATDASFVDVDWETSVHEMADFSGARLENTRLSLRSGSHSFEGAQIIGGKLEGRVEEVDFSNAMLEGLDLGALHVDGVVDMTGVQVRGGVFLRSVEGVNMTGAALVDVDLAGIRYDECTVLPEGLDPVAVGMKLVPPSPIIQCGDNGCQRVPDRVSSCRQ